MSNSSQPFVSVVIPVFNDAERLKTCLDALANQTYPKSLYEIIVVDNGSDEDIEGLVSRFEQAHLTYESCPGSYAARNKGISLTKGEIIAFTDADCVPALDWIEKGTANLLRLPNCGLVAGRIDLFFKDPAQPTAAELYETVLMSFPQKKFVEEKQYGVTANLFTFKKVIEDVGHFNDAIKSGGDLEWGQRVFAAGYQQIYADDTCVAHPTRDSLDQLVKRSIRVMGGRLDLKGESGYQFGEFIKDLAIGLAPPFRIYFRIWSDKRLKGNKQKIQVLYVLLLLKYLRVWERIRLQFGGKSIRG